MVKIILPPHAKHLPNNGGRRYDSLHFTQRKPCCENFLRFPFVSFKKCFSITRRATSLSLTARIFTASCICPFTLSSMEGSSLYAEQLIPMLILVVPCVNPIPSYCSGVFTLFFICSTFTAFALWYSSSASYSCLGYSNITSSLNA